MTNFVSDIFVPLLFISFSSLLGGYWQAYAGIYRISFNTSRISNTRRVSNRVSKIQWCQVSNKRQVSNSGGFKGGGVTGVRPPKRVSHVTVKMVYKQFARSSRIKNWINDNQQLLVNSLINKTIHVSQSARLYCYTSLLDITLLRFA